MDCTDIKALLSGILDGQLDAPTRHEAERHLASCQPCRTFVSEAEAADALVAADAWAMAGGSGARLGADFEAAVLARTVLADRRIAGRWVTWTGWMAAAASIALAMIIWTIDRARLIDSTNGPRPIGLEMAGGSVVPAGLLRSFTTTAPLSEDAFVLRTGSDQHRAVELPVANTPAAAQPEAAPIDRADAQTLYAASILLDMLEDADEQSFGDVERVRRIAEYDELLPRLAQTRARLAESDRPAVLAAESVLWRAVRGPVSVEDVQEMRQTILQLRLAGQLEELSNRPSSSLSL